MSASDDPFEQLSLDLTSEPSLGSGQQNSSEVRTSHKVRRSENSQLYFGCCRVVAHLRPPAHVLRGESDLWRVHCPKCGGLLEILFQ